MALIRQINIKKPRIRAEATNAYIKVTGDYDARFSLEVTRSSDGRYYNFQTKTFSSTVTSKSRLKNQRPGTFSISIPAAAGGDTYTVYFWAEPHFNTAFSYGNSNNILRKKLITQVGNSTVTFTATGTGTTTSLGSLAGSVINSFSSSTCPINVLTEKQISVPDSVSDYGYFITTTNNSTDLNNGTWKDDALYWQTTEANVGGTAADSDQVVVADLAGLVVGMELTYITGTTAPGSATTITAINTTTKTLTLSRNQAITSGHTMTFRAYGPRLIQNAINIKLTLSNPTVRLGQTTTNIHADITSDISEGADIEIKSTQGISKGATIRMRGVKKDSESSSCIIASISTASTTQGSITLGNGEIQASSARPIRAGSKVYIDGSSNKVYLNGTLGVVKFPEANQTIYIDTTKILTQGTAS